MPIFYKISLTGIVLTLLGAGCIGTNSPSPSTPTPEPEKETTVETHEALEMPTSIDLKTETATYSNDAGYSFSYPTDLTLWSEIDPNGPGTVEAFIEAAATKDDPIVHVAKNPLRMFSMEINTLTFTLIETNEEPIKWAQNNIYEFGGDYHELSETTLQGRKAVDDYNEYPGLGDPYRTLVIDLGDKLLVVEQGFPDNTFDSVIDSLELE